MKLLENLPAILRLSEDEAREYLEGIRWPNGPTCPKCGTIGEAAKLKGGSTRPGVYKCRGCRKPFTVTVDTIMHRSKLPLSKWIAAFHLLCSSKKGISALQLQRQLGLGSYQSAWHMAHRIRHAMLREPLASMLTGTVEVDETYVGGKPPKHGFGKGKTARAKWSSKVPVLALIARDGEARAFPVERVNGATLKGAVREHVHPAAQIQTDENALYRGLDAEFAGHATVCHSRGEYHRKSDGAGINGAESYFALLKRGLHGSFHHVSKYHLGRYCDEFSFRWTRRKMSDGQRTVEAVRGAGGKRLTYRKVIRQS